MNQSPNELRILLVDDDVPLLEMLSDYLQSVLHAVVFTASSIPKAIEKIKRDTAFDVVVTDYQVPPHTALDLAHYLRTHQVKLPLVLHSAFDGINQKLFENETFLGLVTKPAHREIAKVIVEKFPGAKKNS